MDNLSCAPAASHAMSLSKCAATVVSGLLSYWQPGRYGPGAGPVTVTVTMTLALRLLGYAPTFRRNFQVTRLTVTECHQLRLVAGPSSAQTCPRPGPGPAPAVETVTPGRARALAGLSGRALRASPVTTTSKSAAKEPVSQRPLLASCTI